jgi:hypothetical protein
MIITIFIAALANADIDSSDQHWQSVSQSVYCALRTVAGATVLVERAIRARLLHAHLLLAASARRAVLARVDHAADANLQKAERRMQKCW